MARQNRRDIFDPNEVGAYHAVQRTVRRAWLCGMDPVSGKSFEHRRTWIQNRLQELAASFGLRCARVRFGIRDSVLVSFQWPFAGEPLRVIVQFAWHLAVSSLRRCPDDSIQIVRTILATLQKYIDDTDRLPYRDRQHRCEIPRIHLHLRRTARLSLQISNPLKRGWHGGQGFGATPGRHLQPSIRLV